jgi:hypothetical protein
VLNASVNRKIIITAKCLVPQLIEKRIIRVFRSSVGISVLRCDAAWFRRVTTVATDSDDAIITERERERAMVLKEGADGRGAGHILSYIEWYHIIGMDIKLKLIKT